MRSGRIAGVLLLLFLSGCSTIADTTGTAFAGEYLPGRGPHVMGGVRIDVAVLSAERTNCSGMLEFLHVVDFPFSLGLDIVFLPFTLIYSLF